MILVHVALVKNLKNVMDLHKVLIIVILSHHLDFTSIAVNQLYRSS